MIISFVCWLIGMAVLKDYGWQFKEGIGIAMACSGLIELITWIFVVGSFMGWGA